MVLENVKPGLVVDVFNGASKLGLLVMSCHFGLASCDWDCLLGVRFPGDGVGSRCHKHPTYKLPLLAVYFFPIQNQKMVVNSTDNFLLHLRKVVKINQLP
jgi:hypothetical protein